MTRSARPLWLGEDRRRFDHIRVHLDVVKDPKVGPYHFAVYCALVAHAEIQTGDARPSVETIVGYFKGTTDKGSPRGMGERTARYCIGDLVRWRYIEVEQRVGAASLYRVLEPPTLAGAAGVRLVTPAGGAGESGTTDRATPAGGADELEPSNKNQEQERARAFEELWNTYPARSGRKLHKAKALEQFRKIKPADYSTLQAGLRNYAAACDAGVTLAADAFRWLRDRSWEEWAEDVKGSSGKSTGPTDTPRCEHGFPVTEDDDGWFSNCRGCDGVALERAAKAWRARKEGAA